MANKLEGLVIPALLAYFTHPTNELTKNEMELIVLWSSSYVGMNTRLVYEVPFDRHQRVC